jgi:hypothetical protein
MPEDAPVTRMIRFSSIGDVGLVALRRGGTSQIEVFALIYAIEAQPFPYSRRSDNRTMAFTE